MGGVRLKDLKVHTNSVGGAWGEDTWAALVKDNCEAVLDSSSGQSDTRKEETRPKRALLIPLSTFTSAQIMKIANMTGQTEDFKKLGADEETPSGVEDVRNSTQRSAASSYNLVLEDVSIIPTPEEDLIAFEEIERPQEVIFMEEEREDMMELTNVDNIDESSVKNNTENETESQEAIEFSELQQNKTRNVSVVESGNKSTFICDCGFVSSSKSGSSRHKCRDVSAIGFPCNNCGKICKNAGGLKKHQAACEKNTTKSNDIECSDLSSNKSLIFKCHICEKQYKSAKTLNTHQTKFHTATEEQIPITSEATLSDHVISDEVDCELCA